MAPGKPNVQIDQASEAGLKLDDQRRIIACTGVIGRGTRFQFEDGTLTVRGSAAPSFVEAGNDERAMVIKALETRFGDRRIEVDSDRRFFLHDTAAPSAAELAVSTHLAKAGRAVREVLGVDRQQVHDNGMVTFARKSLEENSTPDEVAGALRVTFSKERNLEDLIPVAVEEAQSVTGRRATAERIVKLHSLGENVRARIAKKETGEDVSHALHDELQTATFNGATFERSEGEITDIIDLAFEEARKILRKEKTAAQSKKVKNRRDARLNPLSEAFVWDGVLQERKEGENSLIGQIRLRIQNREDETEIISYVARELEKRHVDRAGEIAEYAVERAKERSFNHANARRFVSANKLYQTVLTADKKELDRQKLQAQLNAEILRLLGNNISDEERDDIITAAKAQAASITDRSKQISAIKRPLRKALGIPGRRVHEIGMVSVARRAIQDDPAIRSVQRVLRDAFPDEPDLEEMIKLARQEAGDGTATHKADSNIVRRDGLSKKVHDELVARVPEADIRSRLRVNYATFEFNGKKFVRADNEVNSIIDLAFVGAETLRLATLGARDNRTARNELLTIIPLTAQSEWDGLLRQRNIVQLIRFMRENGGEEENIRTQIRDILEHDGVARSTELADYAMTRSQNSAFNKKSAELFAFHHNDLLVLARKGVRNHHKETVLRVEVEAALDRIPGDRCDEEIGEIVDAVLTRAKLDAKWTEVGEKLPRELRDVAGISVSRVRKNGMLSVARGILGTDPAVVDSEMARILRSHFPDVPDREGLIVTAIRQARNQDACEQADEYFVKNERMAQAVFEGLKAKDTEADIRARLEAKYKKHSPTGAPLDRNSDELNSIVDLAIERGRALMSRYEAMEALKKAGRTLKNEALSRVPGTDAFKWDGILRRNNVVSHIRFQRTQGEPEDTIRQQVTDILNNLHLPHVDDLLAYAFDRAVDPSWLRRSAKLFVFAHGLDAIVRQMQREGSSEVEIVQRMRDEIDPAIRSSEEFDEIIRALGMRREAVDKAIHWGERVRRKIPLTQDRRLDLQAMDLGLYSEIRTLTAQGRIPGMIRADLLAHNYSADVEENQRLVDYAIRHWEDKGVMERFVAKIVKNDNWAERAHELITNGTYTEQAFRDEIDLRYPQATDDERSEIMRVALASARARIDKEELWAKWNPVNYPGRAWDFLKTHKEQIKTGAKYTAYATALLGLGSIGVVAGGLALGVYGLKKVAPFAVRAGHRGANGVGRIVKAGGQTIKGIVTGSVKAVGNPFVRAYQAFNWGTAKVKPPKQTNPKGLFAPFRWMSNLAGRGWYRGKQAALAATAALAIGSYGAIEGAGNLLIHDVLGTDMHMLVPNLPGSTSHHETPNKA